MGYLYRYFNARVDPRELLPGSKSVIVAALSYHQEPPTGDVESPGQRGRVAMYAWGDDYHDVLGGRLDALLGWMREASGEPFDARAYVDTGPVQERVYAQYAGVGWIGKNTCVINPDVGSWILLGVVICSLPLEPDAPALDQCGTCTLCLEACPTGAIVEPWVVDATRCLSYLTIELKNAIPEPKREALGAHVFGCDICQDVCPWNATPPISGDPAWQPRVALDHPRLLDLWNQSDPELAAAVAGGPLMRPKVRGLRRNLAVALGNSGHDEAGRALAEARDDPSIADPLVAEHVSWARRRLETRERPAE